MLKLNKETHSIEVNVVDMAFVVGVLNATIKLMEQVDDPDTDRALIDFLRSFVGGVEELIEEYAQQDNKK